MGAGLMPSGLSVTQDAYEQMIAHCQRDYPREACGLLAGRGNAASKPYSMRNVEESPISYQMDPKEQLTVMKRMRQADEQMLAIYHSHTASAAYPSPVDVRFAVYPDVSYVVVSLVDRQRPEVRSFRIVEGRISEEDLRVSGERL